MTDELLKINEQTDDQLVIIKEFQAPADIVFKALTELDHVSKWNSPQSMEVSQIEGDVKPGGSYKLVMRSLSNTEYTMALTGTYKEVRAPQKIVYTQAYQMPDGQMGPETEIEINLSEEQGKTKMIFHHRGLPSRKGRDGAISGWEQAFDKLSALITELK